MAIMFTGRRRIRVRKKRAKGSIREKKLRFPQEFKGVWSAHVLSTPRFPEEYGMQAGGKYSKMSIKRGSVKRLPG